MGRNTSVLLFLLLISASSSLWAAEDSYSASELEQVESDQNAITIKLNPTVKRKKGDVRILADTFQSLPELKGASIAAASRDLLVLIPTSKQSTDQLVRVLLQQPEVYELEIGEQVVRRDGDKPYDVLRKEKLSEMLSGTKARLKDQIKDRIRSLLGMKRKQRAAEKGGGSADGGRALGAKGAGSGQGVKRPGRRVRVKARPGVRRGNKRAALAGDEQRPEL